MKVLITGGNGFVGSHTADVMCEHGADVTCLVRRTSDLRWIAHLPVHLRYGSLDDPDSLAAAVRGQDVIIHTAGLVKARRRADFFRVNTHGTSHLIRAALRHTPELRRFVYISSQAAAGPAPGPFPLTESAQPHPINSYGQSKRRGELLLAKTPARFSWTALRPCAVYGPRDSEIFTFVKMANKGLFLIPRAHPPIVAMVHARDVASAAAAVASNPKAHRRTYFVTDGVHYEWDALGGLLEECLGRDLRRFRVPGPLIRTAGALSEFGALALGRTPMFTREKAREIIQPYWMCSSELLQTECNWRPRISLPEGLRDTIKWYRKEGWI